MTAKTKALMHRIYDLLDDDAGKKRTAADADAWRKGFTSRAAEQLGQPVALIERADAGDADARAAVLAALDNAAELVAADGSFTLRAEEALLDATSAASWSLREARRRGLRKLRDEIAGPAPTALEAALAHSLAMSLVEAEHLTTLAHRGNGSEALDRKRTRAHGRAMSAARTLALVRRLALPAVRFNVTTPAK